MTKNSYEFSAYSTLFNAVDKSIFIRDKLANQVSYIKNKENNKLIINNESRLKEILYKEIQKLNNDRKREYDLNIPFISDSIDYEELEIHKFKLSEHDPNTNMKSISGYYNIYPKVFRCNKCNTYKIYIPSTWDKFNTICECGGELNQISVLGYCETCGNIETITRSCPNPRCEKHGKRVDFLKDLELLTYGKESPREWRFKCKKCGTIYNFSPPQCTHPLKGNPGEKLSNRDPNDYTYINVRRGGLFKSCVKTIVDVPKNDRFKNDSKYIDQIIIGDYFKEFGGLGLTEGMEVDQIKEALDNLKKFPTIEAAESSFSFSKEQFLKSKKVEDRLKEIENKYGKNFSLYELTDYLILKGEILGNKKEISPISLNESFSDYYNWSEDDYLEFWDTFGISDIIYIPRINLISSAYGYIKGINKFYENGFVPHFEPFRPYDAEKEEVNMKKLKAYAYPYETEGIMFDLDNVKLVNWLIDVCGTEAEKDMSEFEAKSFLFNLKEDSKEYVALKTLIHSFSHLLIKRSSFYTGLNEDSCSELLFPKNGAFMIYSTSNINIGGFLFVFENSIFKWFDDIKLDIKECVFDPNCINEKGACFSCMFLPEFVCTHFNQLLDRDVFLGETERFNGVGYWK